MTKSPDYAGFPFRRWCGYGLAALVIAVLAGCGESNPGAAAVAAPATLSGSVIGDEGPVKEAQVELQDSHGQVLGKTALHGGSRYSLPAPKSGAYPVVIVATTAGGETLKAVLTKAVVTDQDLTPMSTLLVEAAQQLGGFTDENIAKAARAAIGQRQVQGGSRSSSGFKGDLTKQYGGWH
ncbi:hypothetical protein [Methylogaea oryzae]|uniref:Carboxypeptidase regulatory-like domain-containing protein n=1 Tax=Methylogaea oryzae TaxID=1295382 RepID=A0A8D4VNP6_9GAMM|nr:hypothetical protein [Methylogaea oryzae]BBL70569.1 hypothetical protein MoryE10_11750 [Methylogaea oryzae]